MAKNREEYINENWPSDVPSECAMLTNNNRDDCLDNGNPSPCPSCVVYERLSGEGYDLFEAVSYGL